MAARAITPELGAELEKSVAKAARYYATLGYGSFAAGNAEGGLSTIEEKSMGAYAKSGSVAISAAPQPVAERSSSWVQVEVVLEAMRPHLQADGGDVALIGVSENKVEVALSGACMGCMMTDMTLAWIQQKLMEALGRYVQVVSVTEAVA